MAFRIRTISKADEDIASAIEWYLEIEKDLATRFLEELNLGFKALLTFPEAYPVVYLDMHMYLLKGFPYKVLYVINGDEIVIHAVMHHKQHPKGWQKTR